MRIPEGLAENPLIRFTKEQVKKHPYLTTAAVAGLVWGGTTYDILTNVSPIKEQARLEAYKICNYPTQDELEFARNLASNASPIDRQRANQVEARVQGCATTATVMENRSLSDNGRRFHMVELLTSGMAGATLIGTGILRLLNRRRNTQIATT